MEKEHKKAFDSMQRLVSLLTANETKPDLIADMDVESGESIFALDDRSLQPEHLV